MKSVILIRLDADLLFYGKTVMLINTIELQFIEYKINCYLRRRNGPITFFPQHYKMYYNLIIFINN